MVCVELTTDSHKISSSYNHTETMASTTSSSGTVSGDDTSESEVPLPFLQDTSESDDVEKRKMTLMRAYARGSTNATKMNESTMRSLTKAVRLVIIPKVKFLPGLKGFGSFEQPDFTSKKCWANRVFDRIANLKNASDIKKAEVWMMYRSKVKEQFSLHRSSVTMKIKLAFVKGK